jgi:hypothetical protein
VCRCVVACRNHAGPRRIGSAKLTKVYARLAPAGLGCACTARLALSGCTSVGSVNAAVITLHALPRPCRPGDRIGAITDGRITDHVLPSIDASVGAAMAASDAPVLWSLVEDRPHSSGCGSIQSPGKTGIVTCCHVAIAGPSGRKPRTYIGRCAWLHRGHIAHALSTLLPICRVSGPPLRVNAGAAPSCCCVLSAVRLWRHMRGWVTLAWV